MFFLWFYGHRYREFKDLKFKYLKNILLFYGHRYREFKDLKFKYLKNILLFYGLTVLLLVGCSSVSPMIKRTADARPSDGMVWTPERRSDAVMNSYRIVLKTKNNSITGLFYLKKKDEEWIGMLTNEMGAKVFDFRVTDKMCELRNVFPMMDKWYIKKTVAADLYFFIQVDHPNATFHKRLERFEQQGKRIVNFKKKQIVVGEDGSVRLINSRRHLQYELMKMVALDPNKMIM